MLARALLLAVVVTGLAACNGAEPETSGSWDRLPAAPLSAREPGVALSINGEALFIGGSDADPCPPNADCGAPSAPPLRDGAAFDPSVRRWKPIADAPMGFSFAHSAVVDGAAYLLVPDGAFLRYRKAADRWTRLRVPPDAYRRELVAAGEEVVAYAGSNEGGRIPDLVFDPSSGRWTKLPEDPLPPSFSRTMAWNGRELVLFGLKMVPQPGSAKPALVIAAAFDPDRGTWRRLPDSEILGSSARWFAHDGRLILPALGSAGGGEVNNWGRSYPNGGMLDISASRWLPLPNAPDGENESSAGVVAGAQADFFGVRGWVFDAVAEDWLRVPPLDGEDQMISRDVTAAGRNMIVFGGERWSDDVARGELLDEAWMWSVP